MLKPHCSERRILKQTVEITRTTKSLNVGLVSMESQTIAVIG